jgi:AcrR family transcriptional regulator
VTTRQLLNREDRAASIVNAGAVAFARGGFSGTSMEDVAAETGVTKLILYRHFRSKADLYRAVLDRVSARLADEFRRDLGEHDRATVGARALLTVARQDPAGFALLWRHAAREPEFAAYADRQHERAVGAAIVLLDGFHGPASERWAARAIVAWLVEAVLAWVEEGDPDRDREFLAAMGGGIRAMVGAWAAPVSSKLTPASDNR